MKRKVSRKVYRKRRVSSKRNTRRRVSSKRNTRRRVSSKRNTRRRVSLKKNTRRRVSLKKNTRRRVSSKRNTRRRVSSKRNTRRRYRGGGENIKVYDTFPFLIDNLDEIKDEDMYIKVGKGYYQGNYVYSVLLKNFITCFNSQENMLPEEYQDIKGLLNIRELIKDLNFPIEEGALNNALESRSKNPITEKQIIAKIKRKVEGVGGPHPFNLYEFKYLLDILGFEEKKGSEVKREIRGDSGEVGATQQMTDPPRDYVFSLGTPEEVEEVEDTLMAGVRRVREIERGLGNLNPAGAAAERRRVSNELKETWEKLLGTAWERRQSKQQQLVAQGPYY